MLWRRKTKDTGLYLGRLFERGRAREEVPYENSIHAITKLAPELIEGGREAA